MRTLANLRVKRILAVCFLISVFAVASQANVITFVTPAGSDAGGGPVNASAMITTAACSTCGTGIGQVFITLTDLEANPTDVAQLISDFSFTLSNGATSGTLAASSGTTIFVNSDGSTSPGTTGDTGWKLDAGTLTLDALCGTCVGPAGLIIGPSPYTNAKGSIAGNGPHNPFIDQTATFTIDVAGVNSDTRVTGATFSFGTTSGDDVTGTPSVPEPATVLSLGLGLLSLGLVARRKSAK